MMRALNTRAGRITTMVVGACVVGGWVNGEALAAIAFGDNETEFVGAPTQIQVSLEHIGVTDVQNSPYQGFGAVMPDRANCRYDEVAQERHCRSTFKSDGTYNASSRTLRSTTGAPQRDVNWATTDTISTRLAWVTHKEHASGRTDESSFRSSVLFAGTRSGATIRVMNGADTSFKSFAWSDTNRVVRNTTVHAYSNVKLSMNADSWPTDGVIVTQTESLTMNDANPNHAAPRYHTSIVYFNGTPHVDFIDNGRQYVLDLRSGVATQK
jgi:hypothetical protein